MALPLTKSTLGSEIISDTPSKALWDHYEDPFHAGPMASCTHNGEASNPDCPDGTDVTVIQLRISDGRIDEAWFDGQGCVWSQAAASLLTEQLEGLSIEGIDVSSLQQRLINTAEGNVPASRQTCLLLPLRSLAAALRDSVDEETGPSFSGPHLGDEQ